MTQNTILFATSNKGKIAWLERSLKMAGLDDWRVEMKPMELVEIQSDSIAEISLHKARQAYEMVKQPVLVMDGGFSIHELNGFPGPFARYMFEQMGAQALGKLAGTLNDKSCSFDNVVTYMDGPESYEQFFDNTGSIFTLTPDIWPHDHPQQWSCAWRLLVPSGLGYTIPLAGFSDEELAEYSAKRAVSDEDNSSLNGFVTYLRNKIESSPKARNHG